MQNHFKGPQFLFGVEFVKNKCMLKNQPYVDIICLKTSNMQTCICHYVTINFSPFKKRCKLGIMFKDPIFNLVLKLESKSFMLIKHPYVYKAKLAMQQYAGNVHYCNK